MVLCEFTIKFTVKYRFRMKRVVTAILKTYLASADVIITTVMLIVPLYYIHIDLYIYIYIVYTARIIIMTENIIMLNVSTFVNVYVITLYALCTYNTAFAVFLRHTAKLKFNSCETRRGLKRAKKITILMT